MVEQGIDLSIFNTTHDVSDTVEGLSSKNTFKYKLTENKVEIRSIEYPSEFFFTASVEDGVFRYEVRTTDEAGDKFKDLFAKKLLDATLEYFDKRGTAFSVWESQWLRDVKLGGIWQEFIDNLDVSLEEASEEDCVLAIKQTWGYKNAAKHEFKFIQKAVVFRSRIQKKVIVSFVKESTEKPVVTFL